MLNLTPQDLDLPPKFKKWEGQQEDVIEKIVRSPRWFYLLDAPTGSGKSVIGIAASYIWRTNWLTARRLEGEDVKLPKRVIDITRTKQLQEQLLADFPNSRTIKGRSNFPCLLAPAKMTADDCPHAGKGTHCPYKESCPYLLAKIEALEADIAVLNESYFMAEANGPGQFSGADYIIVDEVDSIESTLLNTVSVPVTLSMLEDFKIEPPANWEDWREWVVWWNRTGAQRVSVLTQAGRQLSMDSDNWSDLEIKANRHMRRLENFHLNLNQFMDETLLQILEKSGAKDPAEAMRITLSGTETPFVVQEIKDKNGYISKFELKPVLIRNFAFKRLWRHGTRFLGMSGTILSPVVMARELGLKEEDYEYRQIPSPFPTKNRPIYYWPVANMRKQNIDSGRALEPMLAAIDKIINKYPNDKILIHTTSYPMVSAIRHDQVDLKGSQRIITHDAENRVAQLEAFKASKRPLVMLSPSFDRGVDLPDDLCRCVIICKVPYLNLGDKQIAARLKAPGGDQWYVFKAIQTIMQMTGRGVRNMNDYCDTYILDQQFTGLMARVRHYVPQWWLDAIRRIEQL